MGLDFICISGLQLNVPDQKYSFKLTPKEEHFFQPGQASVPVGKPQHLKKRNQFSERLNATLSMLSSIPPSPSYQTPQTPNNMDDKTLIERAVMEAHLPTEGKQGLLELLESNPRVCTLRLGKTNVLQHHLYTTHPVPIKQRPYRLSPEKQAVVKEHLREMLDDGIIELSHSAWASPIVLVPKKDGSQRFCVDYRKVNAITERDAYPLPNITEILESLSGAAIFSTIDLNSGYWQVTMDPESKPKTAFITSSNVMPFGLKSAPATFQRLMETVLGDLQGKLCFVYIDDIIIYSPSVTQHFHDLQAVLCCLQTAGLTINLKKSKFCLSELKFLGHVVSVKGVTADSSKVEAMQSYPVPTNLKQVQQFLGLAGWYHRFVPNFSQIAEPLNNLKKKGHSFQWSTQCQQAFDQLKACLISPPILGHPDLQRSFFVYTDACDQAGEEVLAYTSRTLNKAETNYSTTEKECLAIVWALEKWQHYLEPKLFTIITDHSALQWVLSFTRTTSHLIRWALRLQKFDFVVEYRKGKLNVAPDALSRMHTGSGCNLYSSNKEDFEDCESPVTNAIIWEEQHKDCKIMMKSNF